MKSLKEAIKQKKFASPMEMVLVNVLYTSNWYRDAQMPLFKKYGLQPQHFNVLKIVKGKHPNAVSPGYIIEVMLDKGRDLTRLVDKLVKLDLLKRETCPTNRRKVDIYITEEGLAITKEMEQDIMSLSNNLDENLSIEEAEQLSFLLDKLRG